MVQDRKSESKRNFSGDPWWFSGLRLQCFHYHGSGHCCGTGSMHMPCVWPKKKEKKKKRNSSISQLLGADAHAFARISFFLEGDGRCLGVRNSIPQALQFPELHFEPMLRSESSPTRPDKHCGPSLRLPAIIK